MSPTTLPAPSPGERATIAAHCRGARTLLIVTGAIGYPLLGLVAMVPVSMAADSVGVDIPTKAMLGVAGALGLVATVLGARVGAWVGPDGVRVRNRWRRAQVPWNDLTSVELSSSVPYSIVLFYETLRWRAEPGRHAATGGLAADVITLHRKGRRLGLPVYATLGHPPTNQRLALFRDALAAAGHPVTEGVTFDADSLTLRSPEPTTDVAGSAPPKVDPADLLDAPRRS